jgi:hypothetical protein
MGGYLIEPYSIFASSLEAGKQKMQGSEAVAVGRAPTGA